MSAVLYAECKIYFSGPPAKWLVNVKILKAIKRVSEANLPATCTFNPILTSGCYSFCAQVIQHVSGVFQPHTFSAKVKFVVLLKSFVYQQDYTKTAEWISTKLGWICPE